MLPPRALPRQVLRVGAGVVWDAISARLPASSPDSQQPVYSPAAPASGPPSRAARSGRNDSNTATALVSGLLDEGRAAGDHVHEGLEMAGGPALEGGGAVALIGGHHRVAVVPVQARLRVEPEGPPGALADAGEDLGMRLAAVGASIAEHDHGRARA